MTPEHALSPVGRFESFPGQAQQPGMANRVKLYSHSPRSDRSRPENHDGQTDRSRNTDNGGTDSGEALGRRDDGPDSGCAPGLTGEGVRAALAFAAEVPGAEVVYPMDHVRA